jgi:hypothetical protein
MTRATGKHRIIDAILNARPCVLSAALALGLAACATESNPARDAAGATGFATKTNDPAAFVKEKRREQVEYMPVVREQPKRPTEARSAADVKALEEKLEKVRASNEQAGARAKAAGEAAAKSE